MRKRERPTAVEKVPLTEIPAPLLREATVIAPRKESRPARSHRSAETRKKVKVLVVDDDRNVAETSARVLDLFGYECYSVYNPYDALACADSFQPDIVLSDVMMAGLNGVELCLQIKQMLPECRILLLSGHVSMTHALLQDASKQGYDFELLAKPVTPEELAAKFATLFGGTYAQLGMQAQG